MATSKNIKTIIKPEQIIPAVVEHKIILEMSMQEAQALADLFQYVGGSPANSARKHVDNISQSLKDVGVCGGDDDTMLLKGSSLHFKDYPIF